MKMLEKPIWLGNGTYLWTQDKSAGIDGLAFVPIADLARAKYTPKRDRSKPEFLAYWSDLTALGRPVKVAYGMSILINELMSSIKAPGVIIMFDSGCYTDDRIHPLTLSAEGLPYIVNAKFRQKYLVDEPNYRMRITRNKHDDILLQYSYGDVIWSRHGTVSWLHDGAN